MAVQITPGSTVVFMEGYVHHSGVVTRIRDDYHVDLSLNDGRKLTNVPHVRLARHVGWYGQSPSEVISFNSSTAFTVT